MRTAERFASIVNGKIVLLCSDATPPQELKANQIELTYREYTILKSLPEHSDGVDVVEGIELLQAIQDKMYTLGNK